MWTRLSETRAWIGPVQVRHGPDRVRQDTSTAAGSDERGQYANGAQSVYITFIMGTSQKWGPPASLLSGDIAEVGSPS
jgi:hypothetical protein